MSSCYKTAAMKDGGEQSKGVTPVRRGSSSANALCCVRCQNQEVNFHTSCSALILHQLQGTDTVDGCKIHQWSGWVPLSCVAVSLGCVCVCVCV